MSNALNDKDQVEEKLILAARHLAKQNDEKQPEGVSKWTDINSYKFYSTARTKYIKFPRLGLGGSRA